MTTISEFREIAGDPPAPAIAAHKVPARIKTQTPTDASQARKPTSQARSMDGSSPPLQLSQSLKEMLPALRAQKPHYMAAHIYDRPYLITQGDTIRLPFLMSGAAPGDVLRLNHASLIGSRDYTMKAAAPGPRFESPSHDTNALLDRAKGFPGSLAIEKSALDSVSSAASTSIAPHFIPHIARGKHRYLDDRLFVCRAVVLGVESEPARVKEKTKQRQRRVKHVISKHRFTILKIKELRLRTEEEIVAGDVD